MTFLMMDEFEFQGQTWSVCPPSPGAPSNRDLGIETIMASTACRSGRVNTFGVQDDMHLVLREIQVRLAEDGYFEDYVPQGAQRIDLDPDEGMGFTTRFIFDDLKLDSTGTVVLGRDLNPSLTENMGYQTANRFEQRAILRFQNGILTESTLEHGSHPDPFWKRPLFFTLVMLAITTLLIVSRCS